MNDNREFGSVLAVFGSERDAEKAIKELREQIDSDVDVSVLAKRIEGDYSQDNTNFENNMGRIAGGITGATAGSALGGLAGFAAGVGGLTIPGIGPVIAAGPLAGLISGAATGGVAGFLGDWGLTAQEGKNFEEDIKQGKVLVHISTGKVNVAREILRSNGAQKIRTVK